MFTEDYTTDPPTAASVEILQVTISREPLGLSHEWVAQVVRQVGNYGEMFDRSLGRGSVIRLDRGVNDLWPRGGLMCPLPLR